VVILYKYVCPFFFFLTVTGLSLLLADSLSELVSLHVLDMRGNDVIVTQPEALDGLVSLKTLLVSSQQLCCFYGDRLPQAETQVCKEYN
jgi:hypothetical protein